MASFLKLLSLSLQPQFCLLPYSHHMSSPTISWRSTSPIPFRTLNYKQQKPALSLAKQGAYKGVESTVGWIPYPYWEISRTQRGSGAGLRCATRCSYGCCLWHSCYHHRTLVLYSHRLTMSDHGSQPAKWPWWSWPPSHTPGSPVCMGRTSLCI